MYIIEASIRNSHQWSPFYTPNGSGSLVYASASRKKLYTELTELRKSSAYSVLSFRIAHYEPVDAKSTTQENSNHVDNA